MFIYYDVLDRKGTNLTMGANYSVMCRHVFLPCIPQLKLFFSFYHLCLCMRWQTIMLRAHCFDYTLSVHHNSLSLSKKENRKYGIVKC